MDKQSLLEKIKASEHLTPVERAYLTNLINTKKYGLVWEDKPEDAEELLRTHLPVLKEVVEKRIIAQSQPAPIATPPQPSPKEREQDHSAQTRQAELFDVEDGTSNNIDTASFSPPLEGLGEVAPNHILIEGDNLHALTALTFTHEGKVDVMYFDPPYNTENKDFKYNDTFVDLEDSFRHSKWLSFIYKRLIIAKKLLSINGIIFISIDDNEQAQLKLICDEVFGELNYHGVISWIKKTKPINSGKAKLQLQSQVEYIHTYTRIPKSVHPGFKLRELGERKYREYDKIGYCRLFDLEDSDTGMKNRETMKFPILGVFPGEGKRWKIGFDTAKNLIDNKLITIHEGKAKQIIYPEDDELPFKPFWSHFSKEDGKTAEDGKKLLSDIIGNTHNFDTVKPVQLITEILYATSKKDSIILDFFAGSGTTLHATMLLNAEDNGNRQCILVTNNENNICTEITFPRCYNVINGYFSKSKNKVLLYIDKITLSNLSKSNEILQKIKDVKEINKINFDEIKIEIKDSSINVWGETKKGNFIKGLANNNLRYYRTEFVGSTKTEQNKRQLTQASTDLLCIKEDCYTEITADKGLNPLQCRIFTNDAGKYMAVVYHSRTQWEVFTQLIGVIKSLENRTEKVKLYAFSPEKETLIDDFVEVEELIEAVPLPEAIYNAYRATFRTLKLDKQSRRD